MSTFLDECEVPEILVLDASEIHSIRRRERAVQTSTRDWISTAIAHISNGESSRLAQLLGNAFVLRPDLTVFLIRKHGLFRASRSEFNTVMFSASLDRMERAVDLGLLDNEANQYRKSVLALHELARIVGAARRETANRLKLDSGWFLGSLQTLDFLFAMQIMRLGQGSPMKSIELQGEAFSTLCGLDGTLDRVALHDGKLGPASKRIENGEFLREIDGAIPLRLFDEWERMVDLFGYRCEREKSSFRVSPPDQRTERCIRLGYLQSSFSKEAFRVVGNEDRYPSYSEILDRLNELSLASRGSPLVESVAGEHARFRLNIPDIPDLWHAVGSTSFFREELPEIAVMCDEFALDADDLLDVKVDASLTLRHVLIFHRILSLFAEAMRRKIRLEVVANNLPVALRSLVPAAPTKALRAIIGHATGDEVAELLLELFTASSLSYFDIQYRPLVRVRNLTLLPLNIVSASAVLRNVLQATNRRVTHGGRDPEEQLIVAAFHAGGAYAKSNVEYRSRGSQFEIDVLAVVDTTLVVVEVKRGLLPTNTKELQTTYEAAQAAAVQLDRTLEHLSDPSRKQAIEAAFERDLSNITRVLTCIALTNRMLSGLRIGQHPIRGSRDLAAFIVDGSTTLVEPGQEVVGRYRAEGPITPMALEDYLERDILHNDLLESMKRHDLTYNLSGVRVFVETAVLDRERLLSRLRARASA